MQALSFRGHSRLRIAQLIRSSVTNNLFSPVIYSQADNFPITMCPGEGAGAETTNGANSGHAHFCRVTSGATLQAALAGNREWAKQIREREPGFFSKLSQSQAPDWLWIGCSDSRVPANELLGMGPGEVFVQRNVGNLATHKDMNCMSCLEYAVTALKVKHIIVCGHYNCGAVRAALTLPTKTPGLVNLWIQDIRDVRNKNEDILLKLPSTQERWEKLVELNVVQQVFNVCTSPVVQQAWDAGQPLAVHGLVYALDDGLLKEITSPITCLDDVEHYNDTAALTRKESYNDITKLSQQMTTHFQFERQALSRASVDPTKMKPVKTDEAAAQTV